MTIHVAWSDIAIRLLCAILAGALIGFERGEHGRPAGLRTTLLVSLAACVGMIEANLLLSTAGKAADSFVNLDTMRLPLGILSGMGFIGAGAILRRDSGVLGLTTAATLWFVTILGLCFGGGQIAIGLAGLFFGLLVIAGLKPIELRLKQDRRAVLTFITTESGPTTEEIQLGLIAQGYKVKSCAVVYTASGSHLELTCQVTWRAPQKDPSPMPEIIRRLAPHPGVLKVAWAPQDAENG
jgi:putative Mg2+ transporter-C (MgtC) family protein